MRRLGPRFSGYKEKTMAKREVKRERRSVVWSRMRPASIFEQRRFTSRYHRIVMRSLHAGSAASPPTFMHLPIGSASAGFGPVAMESTRVYWIPLFQILEERGFKVYLVNAHYLKSVPGRKSDVSDCPVGTRAPLVLQDLCLLLKGPKVCHPRTFYLLRTNGGAHERLAQCTTLRSVLPPLTPR